MRTNTFTIPTLAGLLVLSPAFTHAQEVAPAAVETPAQRDARMAWFREAKFGMFIHWGVYAVPAGTHKGEQIKGIGEWIMHRGKISVADYRAYAKEFNPVKYNPKAWAELAKNAGMKYVVITAKHHDGFALFPSDVTEWDIADATPYKRDLITPLAEATRRNGLKFGTYYSQAQDWNHAGGAKSAYREGEGWDEAQKGSFDEYLAQIAVPQTREILTRIKPDVLWWDTPTWMTPERAKPLNDLLALRPGLIVNNRLGGGYRGDTETPEQHVPATGFKDRDWETCMTMNDTWGFKSYDHNWKSTEVILRNLIDIVSKGGNYLLNVGPTAEGEIPAPSIERLKAVGAWMKVNGAAIYGTTASPFAKLSWGRATKRVTNKGGTLYLLVFDWPADGKLVVPGLQSKVTGAKLFASHAKLTTKVAGDDLVISLPSKAPDAIASVVQVAFAGPLTIEQKLPAAKPDGTVVLDAVFADIHNTISAHAVLEGKGDAAKITNWNQADTRLSWDFKAMAAGEFIVTAEIEGNGNGKLTVAVDNKPAPAEVAASDAASTRTVTLGKVRIANPQMSTLELKPLKNGWRGFDLRRVTLTPVK